VPVDESTSDGISVTFLTGILERNRRWKIKITQLGCDQSQLRAPQGCLQYYTEPRGLVQSFNYQGFRGHFLQNLDYSICIKRPRDMCFLTLKRVQQINRQEAELASVSRNETQTGFLQKGNMTSPEDGLESRASPLVLTRTRAMRGNLLPNGTVIQAQTIVVHNTCRNSGYQITWPGSDRVCAEAVESLETPITIPAAAPQVIHFHSSSWTVDPAKVTAKAAHFGFAFSYSHSPCTHGFY